MKKITVKMGKAIMFLSIIFYVYGLSGLANAELINFETIPSGTKVNDSFADIGVVVNSNDYWGGMVLSEGQWGIQNFGNSPTQVMHIGNFGTSTTITFVNPQNHSSIIGASYVSMLMGDGNIDSEKFMVSFFDIFGSPLGTPQTFITSAQGVFVEASSAFLGAYIGSVQLTLLPDSQSGAAIDDLHYNLSTSASSQDYIMSNYWDNSSENDPWAMLKYLRMNGDGKGTYQDLYQSGGGSLESGSFTYSISPHRMLSITANGNTFHGVMSEGGDIFTIAETTGGTGIDMAIKRSSGMSNASLDGEYVISEFDDSTSSNDPGAALTLLTLNGDGSGSVAYSVSGDGSLNMAGNNGIVSADGNIFTIAKTSGTYPGIVVGIRKSTGMSNDSLKGDFIMSNFNDESGDNEPWAGLLALRMDGNGKGTYQEIYHSGDGKLGKGSCTYSVSDDGTFTVTHDGVVDHGIVSSDGDVFTIADTTGDNSGIVIGIKNNNFLCPSVAQKLTASGKLFIDLAGCRIKEIKNSAKFDEAKSVIKAINKFNSSWKKAEDSAKKKGLDCPTEEKEPIQGWIEDAFDEAYDIISDGVDTGDKAGQKVVGDILKATGAMCNSLLNAESANVKKLNVAKLDSAWTKTIASFESSWHKAVSKAGNKTVLTDNEMRDVEDIINELVVAVSGMGI